MEANKQVELCDVCKKRLDVSYIMCDNGCPGKKWCSHTCADKDEHSCDISEVDIPDDEEFK